MGKFGDRRDAYRVRDINGFQYVLFDFKPGRCDSAVYMNVDIDVTEFGIVIEFKLVQPLKAFSLIISTEFPIVIEIKL